MAQLRLTLAAAPDATFAKGIADIRAEMLLPAQFPADVEAAAAQAALHPRLPALDRTDLPLITLDPPGSMDLDQAMWLERRDGGYRVFYAIADVAAFVAPGDPVDLESNRRGQTLYGADSKIPLHPKVLSEGAASLLPGQLRPALLWMLDLDARGELVATDVRRARVASRERFAYPDVQARLDAGDSDPRFALLREIGQLRQQREIERGGVSLALPAQEIECDDGRWRLEYRTLEPVETWNAQISLLTGMAAARLMLAGNIGLLRTLPVPMAVDIVRLRLTAHALRIPWPEALGYPGFIRSLDPREPRHMAMMTAATTVLRGAGYAAFDGAPPEQPRHSAIAAAYAHVTAPLRRLADRHAGEVCVALCAGMPVPDWVRAALPGLPETMRASDRRASHYQRAIIDLIEALVLAPHVGESFAASVIAVAGNGAQRGTVMLPGLAIEASIESKAALELGVDLEATLVQADPVRRRVVFAPAD
ncbi:MAG: RNB domain-containing ribonuclease [Arenimonas sp.]